MWVPFAYILTTKTPEDKTDENEKKMAWDIRRGERPREVDRATKSLGSAGMAKLGRVHASTWRLDRVATDVIQRVSEQTGVNSYGRVVL